MKKLKAPIEHHRAEISGTIEGRYWGLWECTTLEGYRAADKLGESVLRLSDPFDNNRWVYFVHVGKRNQ